MFHYLFTNDLRIRNLEEALREAGTCFAENRVPSAEEDKNVNNNMKTLGFYFNLTKDSQCARECAQGNVRRAVLNFIKKFQFPNPRTKDSFVLAVEDGITIAPMRVILQVLYLLHMTGSSQEAYLTMDEIAEYIFCSEAAAKKKQPDLAEIVKRIKESRRSGSRTGFLSDDDTQMKQKGCDWHQCKRQLREMVKVLCWSGCVQENKKGVIEIYHESLTRDNKADLFEILTYTKMWTPQKCENLRKRLGLKENPESAAFDADADSETAGVKADIPGGARTDEADADKLKYKGYPDFNEYRRSYQQYMDIKTQSIHDAYGNGSEGGISLFGNEGAQLTFRMPEQEVSQTSAQIPDQSMCGPYDQGPGQGELQPFMQEPGQAEKNQPFTQMPGQAEKRLSGQMLQSGINQAAFQALGMEHSAAGLPGEGEDGAKRSEAAVPKIRQKKEFVYHTKLQTGFDRNRIVFGAPGTGKSFRLNQDAEKLLKNTSGSLERVTFHPDYSYAQFAGTYKPVSDGQMINYQFVPGPFMRIYADALDSGSTEHPQPHILLVEEINRARVAAVFGDIFQLLDRDADGVSEYGIQASEDVRRYLAERFGGQPEDYPYLKLPDNLFIWATMNSADQGVYPMDTAFKRRWSFQYLGIDESEKSVENYEIPIGMGEHRRYLNWNRLRKEINRILVQECRVNEDKLLGPFFLSKPMLDQAMDDEDKFVRAFESKVLMYLFEDVMKMRPANIFKGHRGQMIFSEICRAFEETGEEIFGLQGLAVHDGERFF